MPLEHLQREDDATLAVGLYVGLAHVVLACHGGNVAHTQHLAVGGIEDDALANLLLGTDAGRHVYLQVLVRSGHHAAHGGEPLAGECLYQGLAPYAIGSQALFVHGDGKLLLLLANLPHVAHAGQAAQAVGQLVAIALQFAIGTLVALHGDEQGAGVAKVVLGHQCQHTLGKGGLELVQSVLHLAPHGGEVVLVLLELHHHYAHAVLAGGVGLATVHLLVGEDVALQRPCHLLLYLLGRGTRHHGNHHALAYGEGWKLVLGHHVYRPQAKGQKQCREKGRYLIVVDRPCYPTAVLESHNC